MRSLWMKFSGSHGKVERYTSKEEQRTAQECQETKINEVRKRNRCSNARATVKWASNQNPDQLRAGEWDKKPWEENFGDGGKRNRARDTSQVRAKRMFHSCWKWPSYYRCSDLPPPLSWLWWPAAWKLSQFNSETKWRTTFCSGLFLLG